MTISPELYVLITGILASLVAVVLFACDRGNRIAGRSWFDISHDVRPKGSPSNPGSFPIAGQRGYTAAGVDARSLVPRSQSRSSRGGQR